MREVGESIPKSRGPYVQQRVEIQILEILVDEDRTLYDLAAEMTFPKKRIVLALASLVRQGRIAPARSGHTLKFSKVPGSLIEYIWDHEAPGDP